MKKIRVCELFAGIGGFRLGIEQALGKDNVEFVFVSEWDKYAAQIYERNFNEKIIKSNGKQQKDTKASGSRLGSTTEGTKPNKSEEWGNYACVDTRDIKTVPTSEIPDHELLVGGFPCQSFSIAGKREGFNDTRGTLFFEIARILTDKRPRYFILENVKGLLSHDAGKTFSTILGVLTNIGYDFQWQVLNSKNFGVPQNRERVFIVGYIRGEPRPEIFPITESSEQINKLQGLQVGAITARRGTAKSDGDYVVESIGKAQELNYIGAVMSKKNEKWLEDGKELSRNFPQGQRVYSPDGIASTLAGNAGGLGGKTGLYAVPMRWVRTEKGKEFRRESQKKGLDLTPFNDECRELVESKESISGCITGALQKDALLKQETKIRRLTPLECERLQAFPDLFTEKGINEKGEEVVISDTQRYKVLGNAVTTSVVEAVVRRLYDQKA